MTDIYLKKYDNDDLYDIEIDDLGDIKKTDSLDTALLMSVFCEKRADESEVINVDRRGGDWSNALNDVQDYEIGSKLWLLNQSRSSQENILLGKNFIEEGLNWLIDDNIVKSILVNQSKDNRKFIYNIEIEQNNNSINNYLIDSL